MSELSFEQSAPTRILFGRGRVDEIGLEAERFGSRVLIICGRNAMRTSGTLDRVAARLLAHGLSVQVFDGVSADPKSTEVDGAAAAAREHAAELLVGLGGGSAIDAAKATGVSVGRASIVELIGTTIECCSDALPVIAVPTTAGSGAEVTKGAIVTDVSRAFKSGVRGVDVCPRLAIVDPDLAATTPAEVAAACGFDALTHAVETYVARKASPLTEAHSEAATRLLGVALRRLALGGLDAEQRTAMALAALMGGLTVANASTCLPHRLQQAMGAVPRLTLAHGRGLACLYPAWLACARPYAADKFTRLAGMLGSRDIEAAIEGVRVELALTSKLGDHGFAAADVEACLAGVSGNVENDPIAEVGTELMRSIYMDSL